MLELAGCPVPACILLLGSLHLLLPSSDLGLDGSHAEQPSLLPALSLAEPRVLDRRSFLGQRDAGAGEFQQAAPAAATVQEREAYAVSSCKALLGVVS
jgi:hypothetical protein